MSSQSWLGTTLCPPDCLVKSDIKAPSCAAIFRLGIVVLQCVCAGKVFCGLHVAHVRIICPVRDVTHVRKCTRPSPALPYCKRREAGRGAGNEANLAANFASGMGTCTGIVQPFKHLLRTTAHPQILCLNCECPWVLYWDNTKVTQLCPMNQGVSSPSPACVEAFSLIWRLAERRHIDLL